MREIRYRAWNKQENRWATHNEQLSEVNVSASVRAPSIMTVGSDKYDLQMFTGLKDKNGVEIYEGDIVRAYNPEYDNNPELNKVEFVKDGYRLVAHDIRYASIPLSRYMPSQMKVVGNVYEKPELLDQ